MQRTLLTIGVWVAIGIFQWGIFTQRMNSVESSISDLKGQVANITTILMERK